MVKTIIPVFFDYASTLCYVAWRITSQLEKELPIEMLWKGVPIARRDRQTAPGRELNSAERAKVMMVAAETGINVVPPARWLDSLAALQGAELARDAGRFKHYHAAVFRAAFEERVDIGDCEALCAIADRSGLSREQFRLQLDAGMMATRIEANKQEADEFSALGYPTFVMGDFPLIGIQPIETMRLLFKRFVEQRSSQPGA